MRSGLSQCEFEVEKRTDPARASGPMMCGATIRTAASGARLEMTPSNGFRCIDSGGVTRAQLTVDGLFALSIAGMDNGMGYGELDLTAGNVSNTGLIGLSTYGYTGGLQVSLGVVTATGNLKIASGKDFIMGGTTLTEAQLQAIKTHCGV
jgi:hypothetical protein